MDLSIDPTKTSVIPPPEGQDSDFINPPEQLAAIYVTAVLVLALPAIGLSARLFVKFFIIPEHRIEDYLSYFAFATLVPYVAVIIHLSELGVTRHLYDISLAEMPSILYWTNIVYCIYSVPTAAAKLSVLFQLKSIFTTGTRNAVYWVIVVSIAVNSTFYAGLFFSYVFQCWPREKIWLGATVPGQCTDDAQVNLSSGILNIISDVEALLIPTWAIWHLSMPIKRKLAALAVFGVSLIAIGIGIGGMYVRIVLLTNIDQTWWMTKLAIMATAEISIVIFVGCMPFFSRLYRHFTTTDTTKTGHRSGMATYGLSEKTGDSRKRDRLAHGMAKYMGSDSAGMTTLGSQGGNDNEDEFELRRLVTSTATACVAAPVAQSQMEDPGYYNQNGAGNNILKTSRIDQTYDTRPRDDWNRTGR